jgi:V/A-type H+-transporting ATPase subunit I
MQRAHHELGARESELIGLIKKTENISSEYSNLFAKLEEMLAVEADRSEIASKFGSTASVCIMEGWMKENDSDKLANLLKKYPSGVYMESRKPGHHDEPPIVLDNSKRSKPYEFLTNNYSLPCYGDFDPTFLYFLMVPILYGMIVGDVIYGVLSYFIAKFMLGKFSKSYMMSNVCKIWLYGALFTAIFGVMFDEWMGVSHFEILEIIQGMGLNLGIVAPLYKPLIHRLGELGLLLGITALIGLIHLGIAFVLAAINEWGHNKKHAYAKMAWVGVEIGGTLAVCAMLLNVLPSEYGMPGLVLLLITSIIIGLTEGIAGVLEVPGFSGNVLSYFRIAVIGVVGVIFAEMINSLFSFFAVQGIVMMLIGIPLFLVLHMVNAFIAMFEALIQGGRLNLVEFRMKMLKGGGRLFEPFALRENNK